MNLLRKLLMRFSSSESPDQTLTSDELARVRERILTTLLRVLSGFGIIAYIVNVNADIQQGLWGIIAVYTSALAGVLVITVVKRIPYTVRAVILMVALLSVGTIAMLATGLYGDGRLFLLIGPLVGSLLLGKRGGITSLAASIALFVLIGLSMQSGLIPAPDAEAPNLNQNAPSWFISWADFLLLGGAAVAALLFFIDHLESSIYKQKSLAQEIDLERQNLEQHVQERTEDLEHRLTQIRTAAEITRSASAVLDIHQLLQQAADLLRERFRLYYVGVFLIDPKKAPGEASYAVLTAASGEAAQKMLAQGHKLAVGGDSMIGWTTGHRQPRIALDVGKEAVRFNNPLLPLTRSELAIPIIAGNQVLGAVSVQSQQSEAFDQDDVIVLQGVADGLATALVNARLFTELQLRLEEIEEMHRQYLAQAWSTLSQTGQLAYTYEAEEAQAPNSELRTVEIPLVLRDQVIGSLTLEADRSAWTPEEKQVIEAVTTQAAQALENARLLAETQRRAEQERVTSNISGKIWSSTEIDNILRTGLRELGRALQATEGLIRLDVRDQDAPNA